MQLMVKYHLRPMQMSHEALPTRRAIYRFFRDTGDAGIDILFLCLADILATTGPHLDMKQWSEHTRMVEYVLSKHTEEERLSAPPKLLDGNDIMKILDLNPGPVIGRLLEALQEAQATGEVSTRKQAIDFIKSSLRPIILPKY